LQTGRTPRDRAGAFPDARYVELDGDFHGSWRVEDMAKLGPPLVSFLGSLGLEQPRAAPSRALASILFTDIVGSTDRAAAMGDHAWRDLLDKHDALAAESVEAWGGRLVKTTGDGVLATFDGPSAAIDAARAIRQRVVGVDIRAGVHTGEVEVRDADVGGIGVHIGARITAQAGPGEILVSRTVKDLVTGSDIALQERGSYALKGVPDEWQVYAVND
jgi:class 3 adenylate cyclase